MKKKNKKNKNIGIEICFLENVCNNISYYVL